MTAAVSQFQRAAAELFHAAPETYRRLLVALEALARERADEMVAAPAHMLAVAQGRAQGARDILKELTNAANPPAAANRRQ